RGGGGRWGRGGWWGWGGGGKGGGGGGEFPRGRKGHRVRPPGEGWGLDVPAVLQMRGPLPAAGEHRAFLQAARDVPLDALALGGGDERPHHHARLARIADPDAARAPDQRRGQPA